MPFTPSHVAAVLPGRRIGLPLSALAIGAMAPDVPYFLPWGGLGDQLGGSHRLAGAVGIDLIVGLVAFTVWHGLLAAPAADLAPRWVRARLPDGWTPGLRAAVPSPGVLVAVVVALVLGAATHVVWDSFTHLDSWGAWRVRALREEWVAGYRGARVAQYASSVIGLAVVVASVVAWVRRTPARPVDDAPGRWVALVPVVAVAATAGLVAALVAATDGHSIRRIAFHLVTVAGGVGALAAVVGAVGWHLAARTRDATGPVT